MKVFGRKLWKVGLKLYDFYNICRRCQLWIDKEACVTINSSLRCPKCHNKISDHSRRKHLRKKVYRL